ncbi:MAG: glycine C-acetyltransferase [Candidatus Thermoplasmatota archaeon]|nr:glycine C-acetyltransferase [Candidatus Thermoplasmatota archaeon]MCL5889183.1 glycine C-acetyltransferase [Candidatus Thermoplasmatota archaeon]
MTDLSWVNEEIETLKNDGRYIPIRILESPQGSHVKIEGKEVLNMCSNNYLGLANNPEVKKAVIDAIGQYGMGAGAVRSIAGTMEIHNKLEEKVASFKHMESSLVYQGGLLANLGTIPVLVGKEDVIFSEELNHASIIDGMRLSSAKKYVYNHMSVEDLERKMKEHRKEGKRSLVVTDGVFSMDGDIAPVKEIQEVKDRYDTMFYVDDAHGEGVLGKNGRGIVDHFGLQGKVEVEMGTFSKALGSMGGFVAGSEKLIDLLKQRARPFLFSSALNPGDAAGVLKSIEIMERDDSLVKKLWDNANYLQKGFRDLGFKLTSTKTPITPVVIGDEKKTLELSSYLYRNEGVFASPIVFPTVAKGLARIRVMPSAIHSKEDLKKTLEAFEKGAKALKIH